MGAEVMEQHKRGFWMMEYGCVGLVDSQLEANRLESLSLSVVEVPWEHAVTWLLGELHQEVRQVSLRGKNTEDGMDG